MTMKLAIFVFGMCGCSLGRGGELIETLRIDAPRGMTRAELHCVRTTSTPSAVLVLCPGVNESGEELIRSTEWIDFARKNKLGLVGLSFASNLEAISEGIGYYTVENGSGSALLEGIEKISLLSKINPIWTRGVGFMGFSGPEKGFSEELPPLRCFVMTGCCPN